MRSILSRILTSLCIIASMLAVMAGWFNANFLSEQGFTKHLTYLVEDPSFKTTVSNNLVQGMTPAGVTAAQAETVQDTMNKVQAGPGYNEALEKGVVNMHRQLMAGDDSLTLDLSSLGPSVNQQLQAVGLTQTVPAGWGTVTVITRDQAPWLWKFTDWASKLNKWAVWAALLLGIGAVALAYERARPLLRIGAGFVVTGGACLLLSRLDLFKSENVGGFQAMVNSLMQDLRDRYWALLLLGVVLVGAGLLVRLLEKQKRDEQEYDTHRNRLTSATGYGQTGR